MSITLTSSNLRMTKILYAVQATGNGHLSRAKQLMPYLERYGEVDTMISGSNSTLDIGIKKTFTSPGLSLFYKKCGGLNYLQMVTSIKPKRLYNDINTLPVEKYDFVINDFDFITSRACIKKGVRSIQFGHQASFISDYTPRPERNSLIGEFILKKYAKADKYVGLHFMEYDKHIFPPVIKDRIINSNPKNQKHITVYLPSLNQECLQEILESINNVHFHWFLPNHKEITRNKNITYFPISNDLFTESMINCEGVMTGGGFETPAEAFYLKKKLMCIPITDHYEQECNAAAAKQLGAYVIFNMDYKHLESHIRSWLDTPRTNREQKANNIPETLEYIFDMA